MNDQTQRETLELTLPKSQIKVVIFAYIKAKEMISIYDGGSEGEKVSGAKSQEQIFKTLVANFNGVTETKEIYDGIVDLSYQDYKFLQEKLIKIIQGEDANEEKKTELKPITTTSADEEHSQATA